MGTSGVNNFNGFSGVSNGGSGGVDHVAQVHEGSIFGGNNFDGSSSSEVVLEKSSEVTFHVVGHFTVSGFSGVTNMGSSGVDDLHSGVSNMGSGCVDDLDVSHEGSIFGRNNFDGSSS